MQLQTTELRAGSAWRAPGWCRTRWCSLPGQTFWRGKTRLSRLPSSGLLRQHHEQRAVVLGDAWRWVFTLTVHRRLVRRQQSGNPMNSIRSKSGLLRAAIIPAAALMLLPALAGAQDL